MKTRINLLLLAMILIHTNANATNISISEKESLSYNELIDKDGISFMYSKNHNVAFVNSFDGKKLFTGFANLYFSNGAIQNTFVYLHGVIYGYKEFNSKGNLIKRSFVECNVVKNALENGIINLQGYYESTSHDEILREFEKTVLSGDQIFKIEGYKDGKIISTYSIERGAKLNLLAENLKNKLNEFDDSKIENRENTFKLLENKNIVNLSKISINLNFYIRKTVKKQKLTNYRIFILEDNGVFTPYLLNQNTFQIQRVTLSSNNQKLLSNQLKSKKAALFSENDKFIFLEGIINLNKQYFNIKNKLSDIQHYLIFNTSDVFINAKEYFLNGNIKEISNFGMSGSREGEYILYFENGVKHFEGNYENNMRNGEWTLYDSVGRKKALYTYNEGSLGSVLGVNDFPTSIPYANFSEIFYSLPFSLQNNEFECLKYGKINTIIKSDKTDFRAITSDTSILSNSFDSLNEGTLIEYENYDFPDVEASFPGGEIELKKFLAENVKFPEICMDMDAQGRVFMKFTVEKDGSISNIQVERNNTGCDEFVKEATRVLNKMPKWSPGEVGGEAKRTVCRLPFNFKIN